MEPFTGGKDEILDTAYLFIYFVTEINSENLDNDWQGAYNQTTVASVKVTSYFSGRKTS